MRRHWFWYMAAVVAAISLMMAGFAITRHVVGHRGEEDATAGVLGAGVEPGRDLFSFASAATPSRRPVPLTASPTPTVAPATATPSPILSEGAPAASIAEVSPEVPAAVEPPPAPPPTDWPDYEFAGRVLALVNGERVARGLAPLEVHPALAAAAQGYARLLVITDSFGHEGPDGSTISSRIYGEGYTGAAYLSETLWWSVGYLGPEQVVRAWMASASHQQQILNAAFRLAGIGCHFRQAERLHARCVLDLAGG